MKNYVIEKTDLNNAEYYAGINALAWYQSYKGIVNDDWLEFMNTKEEIQKAAIHLKSLLKDNSRRFLLKIENQYAGILRVRKSKYAKYSHCGELGALYLLDDFKGNGFGKILFEKAIQELKDMGYKKMILGCLVKNPANEFYKHMKGKLVDTSPLDLPNGQELLENLYYYDI